MNISRTLKISSISKKDEIGRVLNSGKKVYTKVGLIFLASDMQDESLKVAFLIKKNCGSAVKRNYIKRILRHFVREFYNLFKSHNRIIFLYRYKGDVDYNLLKREFVEALK